MLRFLAVLAYRQAGADPTDDRHTPCLAPLGLIPSRFVSPVLQGECTLRTNPAVKGRLRSSDTLWQSLEGQGQVNVMRQEVKKPIQ